MKRPVAFWVLGCAALAGGAVAWDSFGEEAPIPCPPAEALDPAFGGGAGETFTYKVRWGVFSEAAEMTIATAPERNPEPRFRVTTTLSSRGFVRRFYAIDNRVESLLLPAPWRAASTEVSMSEGKRRSHVTTTLDYAKGEAAVSDHLNPEKNRVKPLTHPCMLDVMSGVLLARRLPLAPGETARLMLHEEGEEYLLTLEAQEIERVKTPLGEFEALRIQPRMDFNPKGFFRRQGELLVWYSTDERRLPLRIRTKLKVGAAVAVLEAYETAAAP